MDLSASKRKKILQRLTTDPLYHVETIQGVQTLLPFQKRVIETVWKNERTAVYACHDVGKTFTIAKIVLAFTSVFQGAKVITTAPTFNQVKQLLWSEIRSGFVRSRYPLGGEMLQTQWNISENWFALGFTSRNEKTHGEGQGQASSFQGFHAPAILVVFDEATGIPVTIWKQVEGILTSGFVRFVAIGNPTTKGCDFYKCISDPSYKKIFLNCFDSPNFPANGIFDLSDLQREDRKLRELCEEDQGRALEAYRVVDFNLLTVKWVMRLVLKYGLDHPLVVSKALGQFPEEDEHTLIGLGVVQEAQFRPPRIDPEAVLSIGVDVARKGNDKTVITALQGPCQVDRKVLIKREGPEIVGEVIVMAKKYPRSKSVRIVVDSTGIGAGVLDLLTEKRLEKVIRDEPDQVEVRELHFGWAADALEGNERTKEELKKKYFNMKARIFVQLAKDLKTELTLLDEQIYAEELPTVQYRFDSKGRYVIEGKEEYVKRTGRGSPDDADSLALANFGRYDASTTGTFSKALLPGTNGVIIQAPKEEEALW